jgi:hypothetical protein
MGKFVSCHGKIRGSREQHSIALEY